MQEYFKWVTLATALLLAVEILAGRHKGVYRKGDYPLLIGSFLLGRWVMVPLAIGLIAGFYNLVLPQQLKGSLSNTPFWIAFPVLLLVSEFCFYWVHRCAHQPNKFPVLAKIHRTHHSGRHMNVTLKYRLNLTWFFIIPSGWVNGMALYLGCHEAVLAEVLVLQIWNLVTHSNFRWDDKLRKQPQFGRVFRALEHVLVSPGIHHTHHGYGRDGASYKNFCTVLSLYDWIFGTLHIPEGRPSRYGVPGDDVHWLEELCYPLVRMARSPSRSQPETGCAVNHRDDNSSTE
jgi:sterol desaturase/sphingolipid hydroxylase (fatty acid hydroxylase superfamily)